MKTFQKIDGPFRRDPSNPRVIIPEWRNKAVEMLADAPIWVASEKIDGTNIRVGWDGYNIAFGGRTDRADIPKDLLAHLTATFHTPGVEEWFEENFPLGDAEFRDVVLFGEGFGPKIQSGGKYRKDISFIGFDVYVDGVYLSPKNSQGIFETLDIEFVGTRNVYTGEWISDTSQPAPLSLFIEQVRSGLTSEWDEFEAEGLVARTIEPLYDQRGERLIVKIKPDNLP